MEMSVAEVVVRFVLSAPSCAAARAGRCDECRCGCVGLLTRHVEELLEDDCAREIAEHRAEICAIDRK